MGKLFGTDGIRGVANTHPMDVETAVSAGRAISQYFAKGDGKGVICIGQDTRLSGDMIAQAVSAGICSGGQDVSMLGIVPTPAVAFMTHATGAAAGVVISASHNPYEDNGIKLFNSNGYKLNDEEEDEIEQLMHNRGGRNITPEQIGHTMPADDVDVQYLNFLQTGVPNLKLKPLKIVVDCSNGATFSVAPALLRKMGAKVFPIYCSPNGTNINDGCGSQHPEKLAKEVEKQKADVGLAFDGDGDRLIAVDENGLVLTGDQIMAICAKDLQSKGKLKHNRVVTTVMSNMGLHIAMKSLGIELFTTPVGDRYVMQEMIARDAVLGGEDSGHMIFRDCHTTGDGIMAALRLMDAIQSSGRPLSELSRVMTVFPQVLINVDVTSKPELSSIPGIMDSIKAAETRLGDQGRVLVRYSGTQLKCRVMVEGPTLELTDRLCRDIVSTVEDNIG